MLMNLWGNCRRCFIQRRAAELADQLVNASGLHRLRSFSNAHYQSTKPTDQGCR